MACQLHLFRRSPYFCLECELDAAVERSVERLDQRFKEILDTHRRPTPEGGSTGLERTQDQLEIALREGDESSSVAQIAPASKSADLDAEPSGLVGLLARVEAAEKADHLLDRDIALAFGWSRELDREVYAPHRTPPWYWTDPAGYSCGWRDGEIGPERFTASLDAALALCERVLPGWIVMNLAVWEDDRLRARGPWMAQLKQRGVLPTKPNEASCMNAPTPALALLCAMLKALVAQAAGPEGGQFHRLDEPLLSKGGGESSSREPSPSIRGVVRR